MEMQEKYIVTAAFLIEDIEISNVDGSV